MIAVCEDGSMEMTRVKLVFKEHCSWSEMVGYVGDIVTMDWRSDAWAERSVTKMGNLETATEFQEKIKSSFWVKMSIVDV